MFAYQRKVKIANEPKSAMNIPIIPPQADIKVVVTNKNNICFHSKTFPRILRAFPQLKSKKKKNAKETTPLST